MYKIFRNSMGQVDAVNREEDGVSLPYDPQTKTFDEGNELTIQLRKWEKKNGKLDLEDEKPLPPSLELIRQNAIALITQDCICRQEALVAGYASAERDTWDMKVSQAKIFLVTLAFEDAEILKAEAIAYAGTNDLEKLTPVMKILAAKILEKASVLPRASAALSGRRNRLIALINKSEDINFIQSLNFDSDI